MTPVAVELLEPRLVMTVTPPIDLLTATTNATNARNALIAARTSFASTVGTADQQYASDIASYQTNFNNDVTAAENLFQSDVAGIESGLQTTLTGLDNGLHTQLNADETAFEATLNGDVGSFNAAETVAANARNGAFTAHALTFTTTIDGANTTLGTAINGTGGLGPNLQTFIQTQQATFQTNVGNENTAFSNYVNGPTGPVATYQAAEAADWTAYLTAIDSSPTGLQGIFNASVTGDAAIRTAALAPYSSFNYDPSILEGTAAYTSLLDGANTMLQTSLTSARNQANANIQTHEQNYQNAIAGPGGVQATFNLMMTPVNNQLTTDTHNAETQRDTADQAAETVYDTAVHGPTGFQHTFDVNVAGDKTNYDNLVTAAANTRNGQIAGVKSTYDGQVQTEETSYSNWLNVNNPFTQQMQTRTQSLVNQITTLVNNFNNNQIQPLQTALQNSITAANAWYDDQINHPTTGIAPQLWNAVNSDYQAADIIVQPEFTTYQGQVNALMSSYMMAMMTAMMNGLPMPPPPTAAEEPLTQDYQLQVAAEDISLTDQLGGAMVAYVGAERGADTFRDLTIVAAIYGDDQTAVTDADLLEAAEITAIHLWMDDIVNLEAGFELADETHYVTMVDDIADDWKLYVEAADGFEEAFEVIESNDYLAYELQVDGEVETFRNSEMGARVTLLDKEADDERDYEENFALAEQAWINGEAAAEDAADVLASAAEVQRENDEAGDYEQEVSDVAGDYQTWVNTVTNGIAAQYAAYYGNAVDATAVANAWRNYNQSVAGDGDSLAVGEAQKFQLYVSQEEGARDSAEQDIDNHEVTRKDNIASDMVNEVNAVAPAIDSFQHSVDGLEQGWMTTAAAAERTEGDQDASSEDSFELILAPLVQNLNDTEASDADAEIHTIEGDESSEFTIVVGDEQVAAIAEDGKFDTELTTIRQKHTTLENNDLTAWDTKETTVLPADDALMVAYANDLKAQADLAAVDHFYNIAAQPLPSFDPQLLNQASLMPFAMPFAANDDTYISWGGAIASLGAFTGGTTTLAPTALVPPPPPPASTVDPQAVLREIQESVQPKNQRYMPLNTVDPLTTLQPPPADFQGWLQQNCPSTLTLPHAASAPATFSPPSPPQAPGSGGFWNSIGTSLSSMGQTYYAMGQYACGNSAGANQTLLDAYANGPLGQAEQIGPGTYRATAGALGVATVATAAAGGIMFAQAGSSTMSIGWQRIGCPPGHFGWQTVGNTWMHATRNAQGQFVAQTFRGATRYGFGAWSRTLSGLPIASPAGATFAGTSMNCLTGAGVAWWNAGGAGMLLPAVGTGTAAGVIWDDFLGW